MRTVLLGLLALPCVACVYVTGSAGATRASRDGNVGAEFYASGGGTTMSEGAVRGGGGLGVIGTGTGAGSGYAVGPEVRAVASIKQLAPYRRLTLTGRLTLGWARLESETGGTSKGNALAGFVGVGYDALAKPKYSAFRTQTSPPVSGTASAGLTISRFGFDDVDPVWWIGGMVEVSLALDTPYLLSEID